LDYLRGKLPALEVVFDTTRHSPDTFCAALKLAGTDPILLLEDDIVLTRDFLPKVEAVRRQLHRHVINFFSMRKADLSVGSRWDRSYLMAQCTYYPPRYAASLLAFAPGWRATRPQDERGGSDTMVNAWLRAIRQPYWLSVPSLVQHRNAKSRLGPRSSHRQSPTFVDPDL
jgi:hypothetical protein